MTTFSDPIEKRGFRLAAMIFSTWFAAVALAGYGGFFLRIPALAIPPLVAASVAVPIGLYFALPDLRRLLRRIGLRAITAFHVWRVGAALVFFWYGAEGLLPERFVANAGWGDFLAGVLAAIVVLLPFRRGFYAAAHLFGFLDFILAVATGAALILLDVPEIANIATFPVVLIPLFGVGVSGLAHIVAFDLLLRPEAMPASIPGLGGGLDSKVVD